MNKHKKAHGQDEHEHCNVSCGGCTAETEKASCVSGVEHDRGHSNNADDCCGHPHAGDGQTECGCGHDHDHGKSAGKMKLILKYSISAIPLAISFIPVINIYVRIIAAVIVYLFFGIEVWLDMFRGIRKKHFFTEFSLMCIATAGAFAIGEFADAAAVMYLYTLGEAISGMAYSKSKNSISELLKIVPDNVSVLRGGRVESAAVTEIKIGEIIIVRAGERIPLDGRVVSGGGFADSSSVTGESKPLELYTGTGCPSGAVLNDGTVHIEVSGKYENSVAFGLQRAIAEAQKRKSGTEKKISKFAKYFTPFAFALALAVFLIGGFASGNYSEWLRVGLIILVISCPCSLVLSVPLAYFAGIGVAAKKGIIFRGGEHMDSIARMGIISFDKTGTLSEPNLSFDGAVTENPRDEEHFLTLAYDVLIHSPHAAAQSFCKASDRKVKNNVENVENIGGRGVLCQINGERVLFGNAAHLGEYGISVPHTDKTVIFGAVESRYIGRLEFSSRLKKGAAEQIALLRKGGITRIAVLSGDTESSVAQTCTEAEISEFYHSLTPMDKLHMLEKIIAEEKSKNKKAVVAFCGDGLNDSAAILRADIGIAMGNSGSALTVDTADVVLMDDDIAKINAAVKIGKKTSNTATANIIISLGLKAAIFALIMLITALFEKQISIELAVIADVGATVITVLNSLRVTK